MTLRKCSLNACFLALCLFVTIELRTDAAESTNDQIIADSAEWEWHEFMTSPLDCVSQCHDKYDLRILRQGKNPTKLSLTILSGDHELYSWEGHMYSAFRILNEHLYYANFSPYVGGGEIVAVDLKTGKELWRSQLQALGPAERSSNRNRINLTCYSEGVVAITGNETMGRYLEFKKISTGETIGHRIFTEK